MRPRFVQVFAVALVLGWSAPNPIQPDLGLAAQAQVWADNRKKATMRDQTVQQTASSHAVIKLPAVPSLVAQASDQSSSQSSPPLDPPISSIPSTMTAPPPELHVSPSYEQMEKLRVGLENLARTYPSPEAQMEKLRLGLERLAKTMNSSRP